MLVKCLECNSGHFLIDQTLRAKKKKKERKKSAQNWSRMITARCMRLEMCLRSTLLWCHADECQKPLAKARRMCRILQSSTVDKSTMGSDLLTTQLMLNGLNNCDVLISFKMFDFKNLRSCFYVYKLYVNIPKLWHCDLSLFYVIVVIYLKKNIKVKMIDTHAFRMEINNK